MINRYRSLLKILNMALVTVRNLRFTYGQGGAVFGYLIGQRRYNSYHLEYICDLDYDRCYFPRLPTFFVDPNGSHLIALIFSSFPLGGTVLMLYQCVNGALVELTSRPATTSNYCLTEISDYIRLTKSTLASGSAYTDCLVEEPILSPLPPTIWHKLRAITNEKIPTNEIFNNILSINLREPATM